MRAVEAVLAEEEVKRQQMLDRQAADAGDTKWRLDAPGSQDVPPFVVVVSAGYSEIDSSSHGVVAMEDDASGRLVGRKSFGGFEEIAKVSQALLVADAASVPPLAIGAPG